MDAGKIAAQSGHAFVDCALLSIEQRPEQWTDYKTNHGIKIVMKSKSLGHLQLAYDEAIADGIPAVLVTDLGYFGVSEGLEGKATITALGIGPAKRTEVKRILKRFQILTEKQS